MQGGARGWRPGVAGVGLCAAFGLGAAHGNDAPSPTRTLGSREVFVDVWVELTEPPLAVLAHASGSERLALRQRIDREQNEVMAGLGALGARERARVRQVRNAMAVSLPREAIEQARAIPGVRAVRFVHDRNRVDP